MLHIKRDFSLAPLTTFGVGGSAHFYTEASGPLELSEALEYAEKNALPVHILGGGSNMLFADRGFAGLVIKIRDGGISIAEDRILCGAGVPLQEMVEAAKEAHLSGLENLAGIPGSVGGAVRGNAGAFGVEIGTLILAVKALVKDTGMVREYPRSACGFAYRTSIFKKNPDLIILSVALKLVPGKKNAIARVIAETVAKREAKHPQDAQCAGSFFINPVVKDKRLREEFTKDTGIVLRGETLPAGWLIDHAGLRGKRIGGAMISMQHPNYLLNTGNATAEDVLMLSSLVKTRVRDEFGIRLTEEIEIAGY